MDTDFLREESYKYFAPTALPRDKVEGRMQNEERTLEDWSFRLTEEMAIGQRLFSMIGKYRNQAIIRICSGYALLFVSLLVLFAVRQTPYAKLGIGVSIISGLCGYITYIFGLVAWAKAKGYSSALVIGMVALGLVCFLVSSFLLPPVVLFVLEDKRKGHRSHSRRHRSSPESTVQNR